jgi:hypothetical protein
VVVSQIVAFGPALAVAEALIVMVIVLTAEVVQPVFGLAVRVKVTMPVSPDPGVYVGVNVVAFVNMPEPLSVHTKLA